jgi:hypothetical protein
VSALFFDGVDASRAYGLILERDEDSRSLPSVRLDTIAIPRVPGLVLLSDPEIEARPMTLQATIRGATADEARTRRDALFAVLRRRRITLRLGDQPTREIAVHVVRATISSQPAQMIARTLPIAIEVLALDPYWVDLAPQVVALGRTPTPLPLGTAPSLPILTVPTPGSVLTVTLRNALGETVSVLQLAGLTPGTALTIDAAAQTMRQGAISVLHTLIAGDFPRLDVVAHGDFAASAWPTLALSQGTGTATYHRRWA